MFVHERQVNSMAAITLEQVQNGYELEEKVFIRIGWEAAIKSLEGVQTQSGEAPSQQLKAEIVEDLSEIESHSQFIQRKSVRVRELVWRLSHI
jgi:hypothetical protein